MARTTIKDLAELKPGERATDENGIYWRKNKDGGCTAYVRFRRTGKLVDVRLCGISDTPRKVDLDRAHNMAEGAKVAAETVPDDKKQLAAGATFGEVWTSLLEAVERGGVWSERNTHVNKLRIEKHLKPTELWTTPIVDITTHDLFDLLAPMYAATPDQERKIRGLLNKTWTHAIGLKLVASNPVDSVRALVANTSKAKQKRHFPSLTDIGELRKLAKRIVNMNGSASIRNAMLLQAHTCQRSNEIALTRWVEFDLVEGTWTIPRSRMKISEPESRGPHVLYLPPKLVSWLKTLPRAGEYTFAHPGNEDASVPINPGSMDKAMRSALGMSGKHVPHGWRASLRTRARDAADEDGRPLFNMEWVEAVLDHLPEKSIEAAYTRAPAVVGGGRVLAWWCDQLEVL